MIARFLINQFLKGLDDGSLGYERYANRFRASVQDTPRQIQSAKKPVLHLPSCR